MLFAYFRRICIRIFRGGHSDGADIAVAALGHRADGSGIRDLMDGHCGMSGALGDAPNGIGGGEIGCDRRVGSRFTGLVTTSDSACKCCGGEKSQQHHAAQQHTHQFSYSLLHFFLHIVKIAGISYVLSGDAAVLGEPYIICEKASGRAVFVSTLLKRRCRIHIHICPSPPFPQGCCFPADVSMGSSGIMCTF